MLTPADVALDENKKYGRILLLPIVLKDSWGGGMPVDQRQIGDCHSRILTATKTNARILLLITNIVALWQN